MNIPGSKSKGRLWYGPRGDEQDCPTGSRMGTQLLDTNTALPAKPETDQAAASALQGSSAEHSLPILKLTGTHTAIRMAPVPLSLAN